MTSQYHYESIPIPATPTSSYYTATDTGSLARTVSYDDNVFGITVCKTGIASQMIFVRRVLLITTSQVSVVFALTPILAQWVPWHKSPVVWWMPLIPLVLLVAIILWQLWAQYFQMSRPVHIILLTLFSALAACLVSSLVTICCYGQGILVLFLTFVSLLSLLGYTLQNRFAFQGPKPIICGLATICLASSAVRHVSVVEMDPVEILLPISLAALICSYFVFDLYYVMGSVTVDDYILANVCYYVDLLYPIRCVHHLCELSDQLNMPDILYPGSPHYLD